MSNYRRKLAWEAGLKAQRAGKPRSACNRQEGTIFYDDWHDGYNHGENVALRAQEGAKG